MNKNQCVQCGYCCTVSICAYGTWDKEHKKCKMLSKDNLCKIYALVEHDKFSPAMGYGCSSTLFNTVRNEKIRLMNKNV